MVVKLKCKDCPHIYKIDLSQSEYFLPARCPSCGCSYQNDASLRQWLEDLRKANDGPNHAPR